MFRLVRTEMYKQLRRPRTWVALGVVILIPIIITIALKTGPSDGGGGPGDREDTLFRLATQSGLLVPAAALRVMSEFFLVVILCMFTGDAIASEAGWGNLRFLLTRPISRPRLLTAKLIVGASFGLLATALICSSFDLKDHSV